MHVQLIKKSEKEAIALDDWLRVANSTENLHITNRFKQQNPFNQEFLYMDLPGAGYWVPRNIKYDGWPHDGSIIFWPRGDGITFIQFSDTQNHELNEIAEKIRCKVVACTIGK